jgi:hypothetical protein
VSTELASGVVIGAPIDVALDVMAAKKAVDATKVIDVASLARNAEKTGSVGWLDNIKTALTPNPDHMAAAGTFFNKVKSEAGAFGDDLLGFFRGKAPGERSLQPALATADVGAPILRTGDSVVSPLAKIDIPTNTAVRIDLPVAESTPKGGNVSAFSSGSGEITGNAPMRQPGELFVDIRTGRLMQEPLPPISKDISSKLNESQLIEYDKYRYQNFDARTNNNQALIDSTQKAMSEIETTGQVGKGTIKQVKSDASHPVILDSAKVSPASQKFVSPVTATPSPATPKAHVASGTDGGVPSSRSVKEVQTDLTGAQREQNMAFKNYDKKVSDYDAIAETSPLKSQAKINMEESAANLNATNRRVDSLRGELDAANIRSSSESPQTWIKQNYAKTKKTSFVRTSDSDVEIRNQNQKINNDANQARSNQVAFDATPEGQALKLRNQNQAINNATNQARSNKASGEAIVYPSSDYSPKMFSTDVSKELQDIGVYAGIAGLATAGGLTVGGSIAYDLKQRMKDGSKTTATPSTLPGQRVITENKTNLPSISGYSWSDQVYATPFSNSTYAKDAEGKYLDPSIKADGKSKYEEDRYIVYKGALIPPWDPIYDTIKAKLGVYSPPSVKTDTTVTPVTPPAGEKTVKTTTMGSALAVSGSTTPIQTNSRSQIPWNLDPNSDLAKTLLATGVVPSWSKALNATGGNFVGTKNDPELQGILPFTSSNVKNPVTTAAGEYDPKTKDMRLATKYVALDAQRRPAGSPVDISPLNQWETKNHEMAHSFYYNTLTPQQQEEWSQLYKDNKPFIDGVIKNQQKFDLNEYDDEYQAAEAYAKLAQRGQYYGIMQSLLPISFQGEEGNVVNLGTQEQYEKAYPLYEKAMSYYPQYSWSDPEYYHKSPNYWGPNGGAYDRARVTQSKHTRKKTIQNKIGKANKRISV